MTNVKDNITPDDKNWTWVLELKCADCGFDASAFQRDDVRARPQSDVWSPLEYGCHVRDVSRKFDERLKLMLETIDPAFENWVQDATAIEDRYDLQNPKTVAQELSEAGLSLATRFE